MTRESADPPSSDEAPRTPGGGGSVDAGPTGTWEADDAPAAVATGEERPAAKGSQGGKGPDDLGLDDAGAIAHRPWRLSHLMVLIVVVAFLMWGWVTLGGLMIVLLVLGAILLVITAGFVVARLRTSRQEALLALMTVAAERGLPLAPAIAAFADQFRGGTHRRVMKLAGLLHNGCPLPQALELTGRVASRDAVLMAQVGQDTGRLAHALRLAGEARPARAAAWSAVASRLFYLLGVMLIAEGISAFQLYFILPKFEAIFKDFNLPLPQITIFVVETAHMMVRYAPVADLMVLAQVGLFVYIPFSYGGWVNYRVPIIDRLLVRRHAALVLRALSVAIDAHKPIALGLRTLSEHYPTPWVRRRLTRVLTDVRLGADWIDALLRAGIIRRADAEVLASASSVGNLGWACRELAATAERRQQLRLQVLTQALFPLAVVVMGLAIATLCLGYFVPLVQLIERLAEQ